MERLPYKECETCRDWDGNINKCFMECGKPLDMIEDFRRYKDTKLTPEQMIEIDKAFHEQARELGEYKKLEEQGLLLKLPCNIGDIVYMASGDSLTIREIHIQDNLVKYFVARFNPNGLDVRFAFDRIGKTVFLTQEEAEDILKEMESE